MLSITSKVVVLGIGLLLSACNRGSDSASQAQIEGGASTAGGPCSLLRLDEVAHAFADAERAERNTSLEEYGIQTCEWHGKKSPSLLVLQTWKMAAGSADSELRSRVSGNIDPLLPGAREQVRYEKLPGIGDAASAAVETTDLQRGILSDIAQLVAQKGDRYVSVTSRNLASRDRPAALQVLAELGRAAATRVEETVE